jgi:predicted amidohydrolase
VRPTADATDRHGLGRLATDTVSTCSCDAIRGRIGRELPLTQEELVMIEPYQAVGLIQTMRGIRRRADIQWNLDHISHMVKAASWLSSMDLPVRLICVPEGGLQGFTDEVFDMDHEEYARECAIDIPGPETDHLGKLARDFNAFVIAQAKARHPEFPGRFFNVGFIIEPEDGTVILRHHKVVPLLPVEHSVTPHNVWDRWIELYGRDLDAFYPVADTEIGRLGIMMANEASYPENARGLAMNGCEIAYRGPYPAPGVMSGMFSVQNRARALDNNMYVIGMNLGTYYLDAEETVPIDTFSGQSQIVDYRGEIVTEVPYGGGSTWIAGVIDVEGLRHFRQTAQWDNWMKDLTTEQYQLIYEQPIYPKNIYLDRPPYRHAEYREHLTRKQVELLQERGAWARPDRGDR